jgi:phage-related protein
MTDTFAWKTIGNPAGAVTLRVRQSQFGDGYSQEVGDGINPKVQSWPMQCVGSKSEIEEIVAFLDAHGGYTGFFWTPPLGVQGLYKAAAYTPTPQGGDVYTLAITFQQKFAP